MEEDKDKNDTASSIHPKKDKADSTSTLRRLSWPWPAQSTILDLLQRWNLDLCRAVCVRKIRMIMARISTTPYIELAIRHTLAVANFFAPYISTL